MNIRKETQLAMLLSLSIVLNIIDSMIPFFNGIVPGVKLGLANTVILFVLYVYSFKDALFVSIMRVILVGILVTGLFGPSFLFSISGALLSVVMMNLAKKYLHLSIIGVSVIGAISHSVGQILVAIFFLNSSSLIYYLPWLVILAIPTGVVIGKISEQLVNQLKKYCI